MNSSLIKKNYGAIDIAKLVCACLVPIMHISFPVTKGIVVFRQFIVRPTLSFFFAASGMMLSFSIDRLGRWEACKKYVKRVGLMLLLWLAVYSPLIYRAGYFNLKQLLFLTPGYLWYLTALIVAAFPFCLIKNRTVLFIISAGLYCFGTIFGGSYSWLTGGLPLYESVFITTRNGVFFGLPMLCVGEYVAKHRIESKICFVCLAITVVLLFEEVNFVWGIVPFGTDTSMYFAMPLFILFLLSALSNIECSIGTKAIRKISTSIYVVQYGVIYVLEELFNRVGWFSNGSCMFIWTVIIITGIVLFFASKRIKILGLFI